MRRRIITSPAELADLDRRLAAGLRQWIKQMRKQDTSFPRGEFGDRLDRLCAAADRAGLGHLAIAQALELKAKGFRSRHVAAEPVEAARIPKTTVVGGPGNVLQRTVAAIRGE
jgi:hypothetical protein